MEKLNLFEMQEIVGGVTVKQYCKTLMNIMGKDIENHQLDEYRKADVYYQKYCVK